MADLPVFPQEIFDYIIDLSKDDRGVMLATALVCRNWVPATRRYLFSSITIRPSTLNAFRTICGTNASASPTFLHHVRYLVFELSGSEDNYFITPKPSVYVDRDLVSWFPKLESVKTISIWSIQWESKETLHRFSSLFPEATSLTLRANALNRLTDGLTLICAFRNLKRLSWSNGLAFTSHHDPLTALSSLPISRILPSRLNAVAFDTDSLSRDALIRSIPLGSIRLKKFKIYISSSESMSRLHNLILFMRHHCLDISMLTIKFHEAKIMSRDSWTNPHSFQQMFEMFIDLFAEFRSLSYLAIHIKSDWDEVKICPWVYHALTTLYPQLKIETLVLGVKALTDEKRIPDFDVDEKRKKEYIDSFVDWEAMNSILKRPQFRRLKELLFEFN